MKTGDIRKTATLPQWLRLLSVLSGYKAMVRHLILSMLVGACALSASAFAEEIALTDKAAVLATLDSWNEGWAKRDAALAVQDYAEDADWTNAFGDRFLGRDAMRDGLDFIFSLNFVMAGESDANEFEDVQFLSEDIALIRSKLVRKGQLFENGETRPDRHIHHLRVLKKRNGKWVIVSHLISQAQENR